MVVDASRIRIVGISVVDPNPSTRGQINLHQILIVNLRGYYVRHRFQTP
jgi:hypothetical protein